MMKATFTVSLIMASTLAQSDDLADSVEPTAEDCPFLRVFDKNAEGRWEVSRDIVPDLPQLSFSDVDKAAVADWLASKEESMELQDAKWAEAWQTYMDAVAQPWNDFLTQAEKLSDEYVESGIQTDQEIMRFIAENTFVDGKSLSEVFPQFEDFLASYREEALVWDDWFNFDAFKRTPRNLKKLGGYLDADGNYHPNEVMVQDWEENQEELTSESDAESEESSDEDTGDRLENVMDKIEGAAVTYGYDPEIIKAYLQDKEATLAEVVESHKAAANARA